MRGRRRKQPHIVQSIDILLTLIFFYNLYQWGNYSTLSSRILGLFACLVVLNNWMTSRSTYDLYTTRFFVLDIVAAFCYVNLPSALLDSSEAWGYNSVFWIYIGMVELSYIVWDLVITRLSPTPEAQKTMTVWAYLSILSTCMAFATFFFQHFEVLSLPAGHILGWSTAIYVTGMTVVWNYQRFIISKKAMEPFLE